jgi:hypothetical protein
MDGGDNVAFILSLSDPPIPSACGMVAGRPGDEIAKSNIFWWYNIEWVDMHPGSAHDECPYSGRIPLTWEGMRDMKG